jgi:exonuclease SbcD
MKLIHLSDLHLGKRLNEFSLLEDQTYILMKILNIIDEEQPDAVLIAGDVYDKSVPSAEAVELLDDFLVRLAERSFDVRKLQTFVISGNRDSPERLGCGGRLMGASGIHLSPVYSGHVEPIRLTDEFGAVHVYMLPFVKPGHVRRFFLASDSFGQTSLRDFFAKRSQLQVDPSVRVWRELL